MSEEQKPETAAGEESRVVKTKKHIRRNKKKYTAASTIALIVAVLEAWPLVCPLLPFNIECARTEPLAKFGVSKLQELQDAGF